MTAAIRASAYLRASPLLPLQRKQWGLRPPGLGCSWGMASGVTLVVVEVAAVPSAFLDVFKAPLVGATNAAATAAVRH